MYILISKVLTISLICDIIVATYRVRIKMEVIIMKKGILIALTLGAVLVCLTGCGKFTCELCDSEKTGKQYKGEIAGEDVILCEDCYEDINELQDALGI